MGFVFNHILYARLTAPITNDHPFLNATIDNTTPIATGTALKKLSVTGDKSNVLKSKPTDVAIVINLCKLFPPLL